MEKITKYRRFYTFLTVKSWKKIQSRVRHKCGSYSSVKLKIRQNALHKGDVAHPIVQNAENPGVREDKTRSFRGFYAPQKHFYGCDGSSWVYTRLHREGMYRDYGDFHITVSELSDDNIICDFIPVLEITGWV